jgi:bla regulator protein BlaR1
MNILRTLLEVSIYASVIFLAILLFRRLFRKSLSPLVKYALWFLLLARLLLPVTLDAGVRLFTVPTEGGLYTAAAPEEQTTKELGTQADEAVAAQEAEAPAQTAGTDTVKKPLSTEQILLAIWLSGVLLAGGWMSVSYVVLRRKMRKNAAEPSERLTVLLANARAETGARGKIRLCCQYAVGAPAMVFPNLLFLPLGALVSMSDSEADHALRHELTHFRRGDPAVSVLLAALCAVYWFNPVVWIAAYLMRADMEAACDAAVTKRFSNGEKERYAHLLLSLYSLPALGAPALGLSGRGVARQAEKRVRGVFTANKSGVPAKIAALALSLVLAFGCFTTACQPLTGTSGHAANPDNPWISDVPVKVLEHMKQEPEALQENVVFAVDADVTQPKAYEPVTVDVTRRMIDFAEFQQMLTAVMPEVEWASSQNDDGTQMTATGERNGEAYTAYGIQYKDGAASFSISPDVNFMIREGFLVNDIEMEQDYFAVLHQPIKTTAAEAQPKADAVAKVLGAEGMMLQGAERACRFNMDLPGNVVLTSGWCFVYVPDCGGLPAFYRTGRSSGMGAFGDGYYGEPIKSVLSIYVDETGVSYIDWRSPFTAVQTNAQTEPLLDYEEAIAGAKNILKERYEGRELTMQLTFTVTAIQLVSIIVSDERMSESAAIDYSGDTGRLVPVWEIVCITTYATGDIRDAFVLPFTAIDGVALTQQE